MLVKCIEGFVAFTADGIRGVALNEALDAKDPLVKAYPDKFEAPENEAPKRRGRPRVEQATAAPGESRDL